MEKNRNRLTEIINKLEENKASFAVGARARLTVLPCPETKGYEECMPFIGETVPVEIIGVFDKFYSCRVLSHISKKPVTFGPSVPYVVTVPKFDLAKGIMKLEAV